VRAYIHWCEVSGEQGAFDLALYLMNRDGTDQRPLLGCSAKRFISNANWSPDGRRIAFTSDRHSKGGEPEPLGPAFELYTMRADGQGIRRITRNRVPDLHPNWQPIP
jgi:Tol biopolymer transport system component